MTTGSASNHGRANRLAGEKSPYLLQHAYNPVDWYAWGDDAFEKAQRENKPIFLSIGYSTCHWCHVMERESFEDPAVGEFLNNHFVSIKVDREERPDVDRIYMSFVQATTGQGGWPLNAFLAPDRKPFFGGTYFPPDNRHGRPGFLDLLKHVQQLWETRRNDVVASAEDLHRRLDQMLGARSQTTSAGPDENSIREAARLFQSAFDPVHGGFGGAPKFPQPSVPILLLRCARRFGDPAVTTSVLHTCDRMAAGGIHDQLGGGFARYSVDAEWLVPHFEKMLYDNAQLVQLYLDAWLISGEARFADLVRDILRYVQRDMTDAEGGFYSAEDADSEGQEGKFYCWTQSELSALLSPNEFRVAVRYFGISEAGNFVDHSHPSPLPNLNVLSVVNPQLTDAERALLDSAKRKMLEVRSRRIRPHRDDKILSSWNGLMLAAYARASAVLSEASFLEIAEKNLEFIRNRLWRPPSGSQKGTLFHRWRDGEHDTAQLLPAYAFLLSGVVELYEATLNSKHLEFAVELALSMLEKFYDGERGGFWQSAADAADLIFRVKDDHDGAEPSGNSVATLSLLKLGSITGRSEFTRAAEKTLQFYAQRLDEIPQALPSMLQALDFSLQEPKRAVIAGNPSDSKAGQLLRAVHSVYQPNKVVLGNVGWVEEFSHSLPSTGGPVVYLCSGTSCQSPTADPLKLKAMLSES